jgi:MoaD family protein
LTLTIRFIGAFRHFSKEKEITLDFRSVQTVKDVIDKIGKRIPQLKKTFCDQEPNDAYSNSLILVNGREISVLSGYHTPVCDGDEVVFIPVVHGG